MVLSILPGLGDVRSKLEHIEKECVGQKADKELQDKEKDEFVRVKAKCYGLLTIVREKIRYRYGIIKERGNNVEAIQLGIKIQGMIKDMEKMLPVLHNVLTKQASATFLRRRLKPEEIEERYKDLAVLKKHVQDCKTSYHGNRELDKEEFEEAWATEAEDGKRQQLFGGGGRIQVDQSGRAVQSSEQEVIDKWAAKDKEFDTMLDEISIDIEALGQHAVNIGAAAERQGALIEGVGKKVDTADAGVKDLSSRVKDIIEQDKNSTFCCRVILVVLLMIIAGMIISKVTNF